jgi:hypothetical protein
MRRRLPEERVADVVLRGEHGLRLELRDRSASEAVCVTLSSVIEDFRSLT